MSKRKLIGPISHPPEDVPLPPEDTQLDEKKRSMPDLIARGGIFFPTRETIRLHKPLDVSMYHSGYVVRLDNRLLNAQHIPLGATIMQMMAQNGNSTFANTFYGWTKAAYGRTGGPEYERLRAELTNFANATMYITNTHLDPDGFEVEGNFLNYSIDHRTKLLVIQGNTAFFKYTYPVEALTKLNKHLLASLHDAVSPLLYMFYASHQSFYTQPRTYSIKRKKLEHVIGIDLVAQHKGWSKKYVAQQLRQGHDRLAKAGILDRVKGWKLKKGLYIVHSAVPELPLIKAPKAPEIPVQAPEVEQLADMCQQLWAGSGLKQAYMDRSVFINVAKRAQALYEQVGQRLQHDMIYGRGISALLKFSLRCLANGNEPTGAHFWAQPKFWAHELPVWLEDGGYLTPPPWDGRL